MVTNSSVGALHILLQFLRADDAHDPYAFRFEPQDYILPTIGGDSPNARFDWTPALLADLEAVRLPGRDPEVVQRVGEQLRRFVKDAGWAQHEQNITQALSEHRPVFLTIRSSAAELYALPWELLTLKSGQFIGEVDGLVIRLEWPESPSAKETPKPRPEGGRILVAWSAAGGAVPAAEHIQAIRTACEAAFHPFNSGAESVLTAPTGRRGKPSEDVLAHASLGRIVKALEEAQRAGQSIAILHLLCHGASAGSTFGLVLNGDDDSVVVDATQLRQQLGPFTSMVRLVVLSACDSGNQGIPGNRLGSVAQALHRCGFQSVIASRVPLSVVGSIKLAESFYGELLSRPASVETAFLTARKRLALDEANMPKQQRRLDWASLQLYARHNDGDDTRPVVFRPFRGLLAFQPEHRRFFFGRDLEVEEILGDLQALVGQKRPRFLVVAGASGTGKSSLVFAGAVPKLLETNPQLVFLRMRPGSDPNHALNEVVNKCPAGVPALLVVDQFEEVFTQTEEVVSRDSFVRRLWELASAPEPDVRVIITLRVDFIGRCGELVVNAAGLSLDRIVYDEASRVFVAQLPPEQLRISIVEPVRKVGLELQSGLADRMLQEVGSEPGALPLLEDALDVLWQRRDERMLTQAAYDELGGVIGALQRRADAIIDRLTKADLAIAQRMLVNLVAVADDTALDTRLRVSLADLQHSFSPVEAAGFVRVLKELVAARLLVQDGDDKTSMVEVAHEALIRKWPKLRIWLDEDRGGLLVQRRVKQAAQQWQIQPDDESLLYRGGQLVQASDWRKSWEVRLGDLERRFLDASESLRVRQENQEEERQRREKETEKRIAHETQQKLETAQTLARRTRLGLLAAGLVSVFLGVLTLIALNQRTAAQKSAARARDASLLANAQLALNGTDPTLAIQLLPELTAPDETSGWLQVAYNALNTGVTRDVLRHTDWVTSAEFSPDSMRIVTVSTIARVWKLDGSGKFLEFKGNKDINSATFSPDGKRILTASDDGTARVWELDGSGNYITLKGHRAAVKGATFSPDGKRVVTRSSDGTARVWELNGSGSSLELKGHTDTIRWAAFSPDGKRVVTASHDKTARVWELDGSGKFLELKGHTDVIISATFSPDGERVVTASSDYTARLWELDGSGSTEEFKAHTAAVVSAKFSPDGERIVTASSDHTASVWTLNGKRIYLLEGHKAKLNSAEFSPDGKRVVTTSMDNTARVWELASRPIFLELKRHKNFVLSAAFSPDGKHVVTASMDGTAQVWELSGLNGSQQLGESLWDKRGNAASSFSQLNSAAFSPEGRRVVTASTDKIARVWELDGSGKSLELKGHEGWVLWAAFSPEGKRIVTASTDKTARVWELDGSGKPLEFKGHEGAITRAAFSPEGKRIVTASTDKTARVWELDSSGKSLELKGHTGKVTSATFSPEGKRILTTSDDGTGRVWELDGSGKYLELKGHAGKVTSATFSPEGKRILTTSDDRTARVWESDGSGKYLELKGHAGKVTAATFSPEGKRILTTSDDGTGRVWELDSSGRYLELAGLTGAVPAMFSPNGKQVVAASIERTVRVWELDGSGKYTELIGRGVEVTSATFSPDGQRIVVTYSGENGARVYPVASLLVGRLLRSATAECLTANLRELYLGETKADAVKQYEACERKHGR